jgi:site-specific DNA recombinase
MRLVGARARRAPLAVDMGKVVAYCRSACEVPGTPSSAFSQARAIRRYAKRHGLHLRDVYIDPGVSGITLERPALQKLLADCRAGKISAVIVKNAERLSRNEGQLLVILETFQKSGVRLDFSNRNGKKQFEFMRVVWGAASAFAAARFKARKR